MLLNLTQHGRGDLDPEVLQLAKDVGAWLKVNGEAVYGSRPFEVCGDASVCYTRNHGNGYATLLNWDGGPLTLTALHAGGATLGKVTQVELIGSHAAMTFLHRHQRHDHRPERTGRRKDRGSNRRPNPGDGGLVHYGRASGPAGSVRGGRSEAGQTHH